MRTSSRFPLWGIFCSFGLSEFGWLLFTFKFLYIDCTTTEYWVGIALVSTGCSLRFLDSSLLVVCWPRLHEEHTGRNRERRRQFDILCWFICVPRVHVYVCSHWCPADLHSLAHSQAWVVHMLGGVYGTFDWHVLLLATYKLHYVFIFEFLFISDFWLACTTTDSEIVPQNSHLLCPWELSREIVTIYLPLHFVVGCCLKKGEWRTAFKCLACLQHTSYIAVADHKFDLRGPNCVMGFMVLNISRSKYGGCI